MTGPGSWRAAGTGGWGRLRASRADREQVIDVLKAAFVHGRLDRDELGLRVGRALASRTYVDLAALTADLPARPAQARPPGPAREPVSTAAVAAMAAATGAWAGAWPVMMLTPPWAAFVLPVALMWFVLAVAVPAGWVALGHDWLAKRARWRAARAGAGAGRGPCGIAAPGTG